MILAYFISRVFISKHQKQKGFERRLLINSRLPQGDPVLQGAIKKVLI